MSFGGTCFYYSVRFITSIAFCGFCAVLSTGCVVVRNVICKTMPERIAIFKSFNSCRSAFAGVIIFCLFGTSCRCGKIFVTNNLFRIAMVQFGIYISYGILFITTIALCSLCAVLSTGCIIVGNIIRKTMSERIAVFKSSRALLPAFARIIIGCRFGAGCVGRLIFVRYDLFVKRMNMLIFFTTG